MPDSTPPTDFSPDQFRRHGHAVVEWIADYLATIDDYPVLSPVQPGDIREALPARAPEAGEPLDRILADFDQLIVPGITHWNHPSFFAYFAISGSVPGILGEMLAAALNVNGMLWKASPSATELELTTMDWLRQLMGLSDDWFGHINDTASISTLLALAAAREAANLDIRQRGMAGRADLPALRLYTSAQSHSSVEKGALGFGQQNVIAIETDRDFRMRADRLAAAIASDRAAGHLPVAAVATIGTTSTTSIDPLRPIAELCQREGVWLHVDGAYGGAAAILPELRERLFDGIELDDSLVVNPHKWLFTPVDISALYTRHPDILKRAFSLVPEYLVTAEQDEVVNLMDYGVQLGRRFRALKLWMVMRSFGAEGLRERLRHHIALAQRFAAWVDESAAWQRMAPTPLSTVCFRAAPPSLSAEAQDALNEQIMAAVNASGEAFLSHTKLNDRFTLRLAIGNIRTEARHVARAWALLNEALERLSVGALER